MKTNLFLRMVSALVLAPVVLAAICYGETAYDVLIVLIGSLMAWEWGYMLNVKESYVPVSLTVMSALVAFLPPFFSLYLIPIFALFLYFKTHKNLLISFGAFYIGIPLLSMVYIAYWTDSGAGDLNYSYIYILWLLFVVWATDTGAYIFGRSIGGIKLAPKISPNKTWAGLLGGMFVAAVITYVFVLTENHYHAKELSVLPLVLASVLLAVIAQIGDLFESWMKRYLKIKDSSDLIPGHGGIFDRVDGLLFAAPVVALFVLLNNMGIFF